MTAPDPGADRVECPICGRVIRCKLDGTLIAHNTYGRALCRAGGLRVRPDRGRP